MTHFKDNVAREWEISVNVVTIKRVRDLCKLDLLTIVEGTLVETLLKDPVMLVDVVYVLCKPQADTRQVTDEQFGQAMAGDAIDHATTALLEETINFFRPGQRAAMRLALAKVLEAESKGLERATLGIQSLDLQTILDQSFKEPPAAGDSSMSLPATSASTPGL